MALRIDPDHRRFRDIVRGKIKQDLRKYISQGELIGRKGKDLVSIPLPQINVPRFRFGSKDRGGVGQGAGDVGDSLGKGDPNAAGNHRKSMVQALEASLKRLKTDYIDLYWLHIWDQITPIEEVMRAFDDLVRQGKILYAGVSDMPAWVVAKANTLADLRGWTPFVAFKSSTA